MDPQPCDTVPGLPERDDGRRPGERPPLLILGASCRAAAASAAAAGWSVCTADLFDDLDLAEVAVASRRVDGYPDGLVSAARAFPDGPWCYTGALENHPSVIDRIAAHRPLAGNSPALVRLVREHESLAAMAHAAGLKFPETQSRPTGLPADGSFLRKPRASAGGRGITAWTRSNAADDPGCVWQRRIDGLSLSAVLALSPDQARVLGMSRQLVGTDWCRGGTFAWCGSVRIHGAGPAAGLVDRIARFAAGLSAAGLRGVVGVDLILQRNGDPFVIEVNPRPSASAELVERATGESIMATHLEAFGLHSPRAAGGRGSDAAWAKAVLFAAGDTPIDAPLLSRLHALSHGWRAADGAPALADIPRPGRILRRGAPILTVFARGDGDTDSEATLRRRIDAVRSLTG